jgi:hypothetical protein
MSKINLQVVIVMRTKDIGGDHRSEMATMLLVIRVILNINQSFCITVPEIGRMWWTTMNHCLINGISCFVRENAGGKARYYFAHTSFITVVKNIVINENVVSL